jgi:anti-anti-sigma factor
MASNPPFETRIDARNGVTRIAMVGELDMSTVPVLMEHMSQVEEDCPTVIMLDLRDLSFIDSAGLRGFLEARERAVARGDRLILVGASASTRPLFEITRTEFLLDEHEAISTLERFAGRRSARAGAELGQLDANV